MRHEDIKIEPSLLACDFNHIAQEVQRAEEAGADGIHLDVMDGHFVPNLSMGPKMVAAVRKVTKLPLDVHLMIYNPFDYIEPFIEAGADSITFHFEATEDVEECLEYIRKCNKKAGLAFCPETSASMIPKYLTKCDLILLMTVHPGFGGQEFMDEVIEKIQFTRETCEKLSIGEGGQNFSGQKEYPPFAIQVDGGINDETAIRCFTAGANRFVAGTHLFKAKDMKEAITTMRQGCTHGSK